VIGDGGQSSEIPILRNNFDPVHDIGMVVQKYCPKLLEMLSRTPPLPDGSAIEMMYPVSILKRRHSAASEPFERVARAFEFGEMMLRVACYTGFAFLAKHDTAHLRVVLEKARTGAKRDFRPSLGLWVEWARAIVRWYGEESRYSSPYEGAWKRVGPYIDQFVSMRNDHAHGVSGGVSQTKNRSDELEKILQEMQDYFRRILYLRAAIPVRMSRHRNGVDWFYRIVNGDHPEFIAQKVEIAPTDPRVSLLAGEVCVEMAGAEGGWLSLWPWVALVEGGGDSNDWLAIWDGFDSKRRVIYRQVDGPRKSEVPPDLRDKAGSDIGSMLGWADLQQG
jgi:hypothetical protein